MTRPEDTRPPLLQMFGYGMQHILSMFGGVIAVPIIVGGAAGLSGADQALLISCALFVSGVATVLQTVGVPFFGSQLPLVQGISFASVSTVLTIIGSAEDGRTGLRTVLGAVLVAALIGLAIAPFFSKIVRFFPPLVTGSIITVIGLSLMPVAARWITGQEMVGGAPNPQYLDPGNIGLAMFTLLAVLVMTKIKVLSRLSILLGLVVGTIAALIVGKTDFGGVGDAAVVAVPTPFAFGSPIFAVGAIVSMTIVILVVMVETTADILAVGEVVGTDVDSRRVGDGLRADMVSSAVAPIFNTFPATAFAQNVGLVAMTGIKSRFVVALGGGVLALLGLSPVLAAVVGVVPLPVLGGAGIALFGTVAASGIRTLGKVNYDNNANVVIVAVTLAFGLIPVVASDFWDEFPDWFVTVFHSGISAASIVAVVLNVFFNVFKPGTPSNPSVVAAGPAVMVREDEARVLGKGGTLTGKVAPDTDT
ncbi:uracil permease [Rhodococcus sp. 05-2256-B2]|uniref:nucleobase:cation symporter-2 family protein n=1 Tax=unclassified Rhodococcus (in: high G+C Gram-positive bacteria) TaxID=192944 RepID=UPI000B9B4B45|nr:MULTISPECIES: nucleobase:cation symporter-2 family protein [unclassified Rhodococcus (in: high G+C Gram-positive bacteria)]OZD78279.1 uracil permease [Rhodococcus sp. 05-2256-B4]OZD90235.1 uracil permease [Rhodococcus sp. 05-2256-B3]OZD97140.1 uracil permease [Rhodococcus sp. 05-2256-B2]OZE00238.1 uracil permease [Rhodococcus sp. 05-2256-B1]